MNSGSPVHNLAPGEVLKEELDSRGWSQIELAEVLARPPRLISELIAGKRAITPETAKGLEAALGVSAAFWMTLESNYQLSRTLFEGESVARRARLYKKFPVKELIRRRWIADARDVTRLESNILAFYRVRSVDESPIFQHAAKKSHYDDLPLTLQLAWLIRAEGLAEDVGAGSYSERALKDAVVELRKCLSSAEGVSRAANVLLGAGVRLVVVEYLPRAKLDGACFWINNSESPVVALSLRLDRIDNFWHTLFHEIDHVLHGEGKSEPIVDLFEKDPAGRPMPPFEIRANGNAAHYCIDREKMQRWLSGTSRASSRGAILSFAREVGVHPGIVVGQLQHLGRFPYSFHRDLLEKVRHLVVASTPTDGFGAS